ncbi:MAG: hypothetical protein FWC92_00695 [Defluviitaleaceae bacterium]|nr:hypothetical protein [Defluviitaleaceae bacterium]
MNYSYLAFLLIFLLGFTGHIEVYADDNGHRVRSFDKAVNEIYYLSHTPQRTDLYDDEFFNDFHRQILLQMGFSREEIINKERSRMYMDILNSTLCLNDAATNFIYPEHLGGIFIGDDGLLVVAVVDLYLRGSYYETGIARLGDIDGIIIESVEFSHVQLEETADLIWDRMVELVYAGIIDNFWFGIRPELNRVVIYYNDEDEIYFFHKHFFESPMISFMCSIQDINTGRTVHLLPESGAYFGANIHQIHDFTIPFTLPLGVMSYSILPHLVVLKGLLVIGFVGGQMPVLWGFLHLLTVGFRIMLGH